ncbi:sensor histidine kinase [Deinococcus yavapaiensis]|uniref:histidine kinase n=1 Tax=Deinococcus yavapaiensis KR-236 TaxID=694435 RepID=A0A318SBB0_9DEIO|nr:HAMP domain-containing sensor histidine kinase [Deinococcus yavapaiensis]PYE55862.1 two-component system sensor histidine kinase QseC [Deinococcus yavapaiensis KR-236]
MKRLPTAHLRTLRVRMSFAVFVLLALALGALVVLSSVQLRRTSLESLDALLAEKARQVHHHMLDSSASPEALRDVLSDGVMLVDARVSLGARRWWESDVRDMPHASSLGFSDVDGWRMLRVEANGAAIEVGRPLAVVWATQRDYLRAALPVALFITVIGWALAWMVVRFKLRPLRDIAEWAARLDTRTDDLTPPALKYPDEIATVARALWSGVMRLRKVRERERTFLANASHDLRTPIAALQAEVEVALSRRRTADEYREVLERVWTKTQHFERLSVNLLTLNRVETALPDLRPLDLWSVAAEAVDRFMPLALCLNIDLDVEGEPSDIEGDEVLLARLLDNLLQNAFRATSPGKVLVAVRGTTLVVEDNGVGFPDEVLRRVDAAGSRRTQGFGVGLNVVFSIAELHGGKVTLERMEEGGSRVTVTLRAAHDARERAA